MILYHYFKITNNLFKSHKMLFIIFSAGVGRSGTFIAVDRLLKHIKEHDEVDVYSVILQMRHNRRKMVQTEVC